MEAQYECPFCQSDIPLADINVANDIALCRACGKTSRFSDLADSEIALTSLGSQPRCVRVEEDRREGGLTIVYRKFPPVLFFLIPFTALWSGFSMWALYIRPLMRGKIDPSLALFGIPFLLGTIILLLVIGYLLFGKWRIVLRDGTGTAFTGVGFLGWTWKFPYDRKTKVSLRLTGAAVNNVPKRGICVQTGGETFTFGSFIADEAKDFIAATIMKEAQKS